jgi:hypothetical protein
VTHTLAVGTNSLNGSATLAGEDGLVVTLIFRGLDSRGQTVRVTRTIYVESSARIAAVGAAGGPVLDVNGGRALYTRPSDWGPPLAIRWLTTGADETVQTPSLIEPQRAFVTPLGAIISAIIRPSPATQGITEYNLYDWRKGALVVRTGMSGSAMLDVNGGYALFGLSGTPPPRTTLYRRDLMSGSDVVVDSATSNVDNYVAKDGSASYWSGYDIFWYRNGAVTRLTSDDHAVIWNVFPMTDGINVVYVKQPPFCVAPYQIVLHDGMRETVLAADQPVRPGPRRNYVVEGGWTAFTRVDPSSVLQVWTRSPSGSLRQASVFGSSSTIDALGADGTVVFTAGGRRYMTAAGGAPQDVGSALGSVVWRDGVFLLLLGRTVWRILP